MASIKGEGLREIVITSSEKGGREKILKVEVLGNKNGDK